MKTITHNNKKFEVRNNVGADSALRDYLLSGGTDFTRFWFYDGKRYNIEVRFYDAGDAMVHVTKGEGREVPSKHVFADEILEPFVGMKATINGYTDRTPATVVEVSKNGKRIKVQVDKATLHPDWKPIIRAGGFAGHCENNYSQEWIIERDFEGAILEYSLRKNGKWVRVGSNQNGQTIKLGVARKFHDYNF